MELTAAKYKQTEVGLIPEDWDLVPLGKVFSFHSTSNYSKAQMSENDEVGCIHYGLIHAIPSTQYNLTNGIKYYVTLDQAKYDFVHDGDVIMVDASEDLEGINKSVEVFGVGNHKFISGLHTYLLRDKNGSLADNFRGILLNSRLIKNQMLQLAVGMKVFGVSKTQLVKIKLPLPPTLTEQKAIAQVLSDTDALIQALEKKIVKKKSIKKGVMQKLLEPKEGWEETSLVELAEFKKNRFDDGDWIESEHIISKGVRLIQTGNIGIGGFQDKENKKYISEESFNQLNCKEVLVGDLLVCRLAEPAGRACVMPHIGESKVITSVDVSIFRGDADRVNREFLSQLFTTNNWFQQVMEMVGGTTHKRISRGALGKIKISVPAIEEQNRIAQTLLTMDKEVQSLEQKLSKYQLAKQGLMQQLLTGRIRLVTP